MITEFRRDVTTVKRDLKVSIRNRCGIDMAAIAGPIDCSNLSTFKDILYSLVDRRPVRAILDCRGVTYLNIKAVNLVEHYQKIALLNMGKLIVVRLDATLFKSYKTPQLQKTKLFDNSIDDALAELKPLLAA